MKLETTWKQYGIKLEKIGNFFCFSKPQTEKKYFSQFWNQTGIKLESNWNQTGFPMESNPFYYEISRKRLFKIKSSSFGIELESLWIQTGIIKNQVIIVMKNLINKKVNSIPL